MTKKTFMRWKFKNLPNAAEVAELVKQAIITKNEARTMLFAQEEIEDGERDKKSLESEIKFLR